MKLHCITAALLLATQAQVHAFIGPTLGVSYVYAIVSMVVHDLVELIAHAKFKDGKTIYSIRSGRVDQAGGGVKGPTIDTGGYVPRFTVLGYDGELISELTSGDRVANGKYEHFEQPSQSQNEHVSLKISAGDVWDRGDPFCVASVAFSPDSESASAARAYGIPAELVVAMDESVPWSYSGYQNTDETPSNSCNPVTVPGVCVWLSRHLHDEYDPVSSVEIKNIRDFQARVSGTVPRFPLAKDFLIHRVSKNPLPPPGSKRDLSRSDPSSSRTDPSSSRNNYAFSGYQSAKVLCGSRGSVGPSFFSTKENLYCDMTTKTLYSPCSSNTGGESCFRVTNGTVSLINDAFGIQKRSTSEISALRLVALNAEEDHSSLSRLAKRAEAPKCVPGNRITSLNVGQVMPVNTYMQDQGNYRMAATSSGDIIVWDATKNGVIPSDIAIWKLGASSDAGLYMVELKTNGQLCSRSDQGPLVKCVGPKAAEGKPYKLTITADGYLYIKNGAQVIWTTNPRTSEPPKDVNGYPLTKTNSFRGLDSIKPGTLFKSNDGSTKM
ncbi:hypothetical protein BGX23_001333, partial [Mortierella sp. AD031]